MSYCIDPTLAVITAAGTVGPTHGRCASTCAPHHFLLHRKHAAVFTMHVLRIQSEGLIPGDTCMPLDTCSIRMPQHGSIMEQKCAGEDKYVENAEKSEYTAISAFSLFIS